MLVRLFNPHETWQTVLIHVPDLKGHVEALMLDGRRDSTIAIKPHEQGIHVTVPAKRICTLHFR